MSWKSIFGTFWWWLIFHCEYCFNHYSARECVVELVLTLVVIPPQLLWKSLERVRGIPTQVLEIFELKACWTKEVVGAEIKHTLYVTRVKPLKQSRYDIPDTQMRLFRTWDSLPNVRDDVKYHPCIAHCKISSTNLWWWNLLRFDLHPLFLSLVKTCLGYILSSNIFRGAFQGLLVLLFHQTECQVL